MQMQSTTSTVDVTSLARELIACLNSADEWKTIAEIRDLEGELRRIHDKQQQELKHIVVEYSGKISKLKGAVEKDEARIARAAQETKEVERKQDAVRDEIGKLNEQAEGMHRQMSELQQEWSLAEKRVAAARNAEEISVPKIKHALSLYANISNIRWDFNTTERVKGYIATNGSVRPFDLDKRHMKAYEVANFLWDLTSDA